MSSTPTTRTPLSPGHELVVQLAMADLREKAFVGMPQSAQVVTMMSMLMKPPHEWGAWEKQWLLATPNRAYWEASFVEPVVPSLEP